MHMLQMVALAGWDTVEKLVALAKLEKDERIEAVKVGRAEAKRSETERVAATAANGDSQAKARSLPSEETIHSLAESVQAALVPPAEATDDRQQQPTVADGGNASGGVGDDEGEEGSGSSDDASNCSSGE